MNAPVETLGAVLDLTPDMLDQIIKQTLLADLVGDIRSPGYPDRIGHYMYVTHGKLFFPCDPRPEEVFIRDIAEALSRIPRFGGNTKNFLSVAEHCYLCSFLVPEDEALEALLHDASEGYIGDMIRPLKYLPIMGPFYLKVEAGIETVVAQRFKLNYPWSAHVKKADEIVVGAEVAQNITNQTNPNHLTLDAASRDSKTDLQLHYWSSELACAHFMFRFLELAHKRGLTDY